MHNMHLNTGSYFSGKRFLLIYFIAAKLWVEQMVCYGSFLSTSPCFSWYPYLQILVEIHLTLYIVYICPLKTQICCWGNM